jgi:poly[(R)-3-hydroxyalkanoate] polymerase subunit PhaC
MARAEQRRGISRIDPFSQEYLQVAVKRSREHYQDRYNEIFESFPNVFKELGSQATERYYRELARCWMAPENLWDPFEAWRNACTITSRWLQLGRGVLTYNDDQRVKLGEREPGFQWRLGRNIAVTPKETVYESDVLRVYHYLTPGAPGRKVYRRPFFMLYSWINAYWILDLTPEMSMVRSIRDAGIDLYMTDWQRPETEEAYHYDFVAYMRECRRAAAAVRAHSGQQNICMGGYCIGGLLADILVAQDPDRVSAVVNLTTGLDTFAGEDGAGAFGAFTSFDIANLGEYAAAHGGMLPQKEFSEFFDNVKPKNAVDSFMARYVYGGASPDDPVSYWNRRSARPVYPVHIEFLKRIYNDNELAEGKMSLDNGVVDLRRIEQPLLVISGQFDHIVPLPVSLRTHHLVSTPPEDQESILIKGGHVRAIVNDDLYPVITDFLERHSGPRDRVIG